LKYQVNYSKRESTESIKKAVECPTDLFIPICRQKYNQCTSTQKTSTKGMHANNENITIIAERAAVHAPF
jgi:hypothetical protein